MITDYGRVQRAIDEHEGFCLACDDFTSSGGVEPDARRYECPLCGERTVYGAEEAMLAGLVYVEGEY